MPAKLQAVKIGGGLFIWDSPGWECLSPRAYPARNPITRGKMNMTKTVDDPRSEQAEQSILGNLLSDPAVIGECVYLDLEPRNFYHPQHKAIYEAARQLYDLDQPVTYVGVIEKLRETPYQGSNMLEFVDGPAALTRLCQDAMMSVGNLESDVSIVRLTAMQRAIIMTSGKIAGQAYRHTGSIEDLATQAKTLIESITSKVQPTAKAGMGSITATAILTAVYPDPVWAIPDILPVGLCLLAGRPKVGKSWLALQIAQAVATGGRVFGYKVQQGSVIYLALEDTGRRLQDRMRKQGWPDTEAAHFVSQEHTFGVGYLTNGGIERLANEMIATKPRLVVIDTVSRAFLGDQNDLGAMVRALDPIQRVAMQCNATVMPIDHFKKLTVGAEPDVISDILGSTGKTGVADTMWGMYRERGKSGAILQIAGRDVEDRTINLVFDGVTGCWQLECGNNGIKVTDARQKMVDLVAEIGPCSLMDVVRGLELPDSEKGHVHAQLQDCVAAGWVTRESEGRLVHYKVDVHKQRAMDISS
jgi:hypothetical protein